ncbi:MAG: hypothetical protein Q8K78_11850, partial [Planctomycetaceae bacterium]|nr:hypothetical protein [Planctomycetaceae bacterium]
DGECCCHCQRQSDRKSYDASSLGEPAQAPCDCFHVQITLRAAPLTVGAKCQLQREWITTQAWLLPNDLALSGAGKDVVGLASRYGPPAVTSLALTVLSSTVIRC